MIRLRPVRLNDHAEILGLANLAGIGMTSLPPDTEVLAAKINNAVKSFAGTPVKAKEENFLFVMEDTDAKCLAGTCGIIAHVGLSRPFYSYKLSTIVQASPVVDIYSEQQVLHMVNDYTGASEIGSLFLRNEYRRDNLGRFLSRSRFLMIAEFQELFSDTVISEIRGVQNKEGNSPFYDNLARHFFKMDFKAADYIYATKGGQFIADLMPKYPIYVNMLSAEARAVIGVPFEASMAAMQMLKVEGFHHEGYIDLFDAGPTMQAETKFIRTVRKSKKAKVASIGKTASEPYIICNTVLGNFYSTVGSLEEKGDEVVVSGEVAKALEISKGDAVRYVPL